MLVLLTVLLALLTRLLVLLGAGAWGVAIHWTLLLFEALIHEAGDETEGRQEDEQQYDSNHARAGHSLTFAAPHLGGVDFVVDNVLAGRWLHQWRLYRYPWDGSGVTC